ncbi:PhoPQ-activated protein PqaA family protein [Pigmentibacter sp. JX0631]|uniref:PhoPQ-activated protein PqaA family protein n=1 Tax=Pigmentibacter sp. JX0631 TaxID=2976982 RepID=UPI00246896E8|nr:PhoPQ-activated protein PqaA family protein [Pigmentibacter sp. JX0631]WGL61220.1 PhoPQ-activated protein PqaA family protein [Pigmentibacter sp. JX0631]
MKLGIKYLFILFFNILLTNQAMTKNYCPPELDALDCIKFLTAKYSLNYLKLGEEVLQNELKVIEYELVSQKYPNNEYYPSTEWKHNLKIFIPKSYSKNTTPIFYVDIDIKNKQDEEFFVNISNNTSSIVIRLTMVPNQPISFPNIANLFEDDLVAHTWKVFLDDPIENKTMPLHLPMALSIIRAFDLIQAEFSADNYNMSSFILSGASKRGWAAWLATLADERVKAIIPIVIDVYNIKNQFLKLNKVYANHWPIALYPYYKINLYKYLDAENFNSLIQIEDPLAYKNSGKQKRLEIPKYIVSSSGDDFFLPDSIYDSYIDIPGENIFRYIPNSTHFINKSIIEESIIQYANALNSNTPGKKLNFKFYEDKFGEKVKIVIELNKSIKYISLWEAINSHERDFRYSCGVQYKKRKLEIKNNAKFFSIWIKKPKLGWKASFIEITHDNNFIQTTPNIVLPKKEYPMNIINNKSKYCSSLPLH